MKLRQHLQVVIKDTGSNSMNDIGWLKAEQRITVSNFHEAKVILGRKMGFCWIPRPTAGAPTEKNGSWKNNSMS